jgi:uridine kinase
VTSTFDRPPTLGAGRLLCVDGPAGSGKTSLARAVADVAAEGHSVRLVHMDDVYEGWAGLDAAPSRLARDLVRPLLQGRPGRYQRYDWHAGRLAEWHTVDPVDLLVLDGVGSGAETYDAAITTLVWVEAPPALRLARGIARDGEQVRPFWTAWMADEDALFARERTRQRADVLVDESGTADLVLASARSRLARRR